MKLLLDANLSPRIKSGLEEAGYEVDHVGDVGLLLANKGLHRTCTTAGMTDSPRLDAFGVIVEDMPRALAFYRLLGLPIPAESDEQPHVDVDLGGGVRVMFDTVDTIRSFDPDWQPPQGGHRVALAFRCSDPESLDEVYARLVDAGHRSHKQPWDAFWGQRYAMVLDPDGNGVDLYAPLPPAP